MDETWKKLKSIADLGDGFIRTNQAESAEIGRAQLKRYVDSGQLERVGQGVYIPADSHADEYALLQMRSGKALFSYGTALFLWGMSERTPHVIDLTVPQGTNVSKLKRDNPDIRFHYVMPDVYDLGITETRSPQGGAVRLYDRERCICDLIRDKEQIEMQLYSQAIKEYFRNHTNTRKLLKYGKRFGIEEKIRTYMEVLM